MTGWLLRLLRRGKMERELDRELGFHIAAQVDDLVRSGVPRDEAMRQARVMFGGVEQVKEDARDARGTRWVEDLLRDTRLALRTMSRSPGFTAAAVLTLAIGIGANTAVWSIVDALMLRALPVPAAHELRAIRKVGVEDDSYLMSYIRFQRLRHAMPDTNALGAMSSQVSMYAMLSNRPQSVAVQLVSGTWFPVLGVRPQMGRLLGQGDDVVRGGHPVVVLSDRFWRGRLSSDPAVIGKVLRVNGQDLIVVGVAEAGFSGVNVGAPVDLWIPTVMQKEVRFIGDSYARNGDSGDSWVTQYGMHWLTMIARVDDASISEVETRLNAQFKHEVDEELRSGPFDPSEREARLRETLKAEPLSRGFSGLRRSFSDPLSFLFVSVGAILLIACGNLAGLLLARSAARGHEIAVRVSLGAGAGRLVRQVLTESMTLALLGGALGIVVAYWGSRALLVMASSGASAIPLEARLDARTLLFSLGVTLLTGLLFGLAPARRVARTNLYDSFKTGGRVIGGAHQATHGRRLLVAQIGLSFVLVTSAGLFVRTFRNLVSIDPGFAADQVVVARIDVLAAGYTGDQLPAFYERLTSAARAVPGVRSVALSWLTLGSAGRSIAGYNVPGRTFTAGQNGAQQNYVSPEFFRTVGMTLVRGREFTEADDERAPQVAIVSERTAKEYFGTTDAIGQRFGYDSVMAFEVVGVVRDARVNAIKEEPQRLVFFPLAQGMRHITNVTVRASGSTDALTGGLREAIRGVDPLLPLRDVVAVKVLHERGLSTERMIAYIVAALGTLALLLVGVGLYGVVAYSVSRRTNEIGVRLALGASPQGVSWSVVREALQTAGIGLALGIALSIPALGLTRRLVFGIEPHDPATLVTAIAFLLATAACAAIVPAWRASRVDPVKAMRAE